ncbi:tRNA (guanosine(37)-N1)-methyltransferase TrmD [Thalassoroseus pseudoceratinae]|uniref:tRNA (guanosine(37)-N1)-methyltransferase TrmD n=1 Tax=Thalassoroseus pseudoceratinae TaxID=2713176 RepID=UPI001420F468|nr:tRNA (guanosine(37)-N1)-methyltransferase TrmD [Thalassoroseus pseudoceratinae]
MRFDVLTLFPEMFAGYLSNGLLRLAIERGLVDIQLWNFRDWAKGQRRNVDDRPYGGGPGMLLSCDPIYQCVESVQAESDEPGQLVMLTPQGRPLKQSVVRELSEYKRLLLLCGRYEGFDERVRVGLKPMEISVGDFIANGGEVPSMLLIDTVIRLIPGVLGEETSSQFESFADEGLLEYPQYTRPREFRGMSVPEVLLNGNHQEIEDWRRDQSRLRTQERRSDLIDGSAGS